MATKPLVLAIISVIVFGGIFVALKVFIYMRTGEFSQMDLIAIIAWVVIAFVWPYLAFFFQKRK